MPLSALAVHGEVPGMTSFDADKVKWGEPPPAVPKGAKLVVVAGDPGKPGPYVMRLSTPANFRVPPHWHSNAENVTIVSGVFQLGLGDKFDRKALHAYKAGGFFSMPAKTHHFGYTRAPTVVQIHGEGPFDLNYVNPDDDPRNKMAAKQ